MRSIVQRLLRVATVLGVLGLVAPAIVIAAPPRLTGTVTDQTGRLAGSEGRIEQAVQQLRAKRGIDLFVAFVPTTDGQSVTDFVDATAQQNSLGATDTLLLVAVDDRTDALWVSQDLDQITNDEIDRIIADRVEPKLRDGDFAGAAVGAAEGLDAALEPPPNLLAVLIPIALVVIGGVLLFSWTRRRLEARRDTEERDRRTGKLARDANAALIATDERIRNAQQETGFVEAEYGAAEVDPLRAAIVAAQNEMKGAFGVRQRLDDAEPETPEQREQMLGEILERTKRAQAALDAQIERIERLRDLERDAPQIVEKLPDQIAAVEARLPSAETALGTLGAYADSVRAPVHGNVEEARKGLAGARASLDRARAALPADARTAARQVQTAQEGVAGAAALLDAIDKLAAAARDAERRLPDELAAAEADIAAATQALANAGAGADPDLRGRIAAAQASVADARNAGSPPLVDPVTALKRATDAHRMADEVLAAVRQDAEQRTRFAAALQASLATAQADVDRAGDFIAARRGGVGRRARTRLAEAETSLETAQRLRASDPRGALEAARRAEQLGEEAYELARRDFDDWDRGGPGFGGGGGVRGSDVAGAILGGVIGGILSGGGRGGGWGGSPWGGSGPFGGGGWGGGGFGGGGGGGLGGLGGGGGRSRGGRW